MAHTPGPWTIEEDCGDRILLGANSESLMSDTHYYPWAPDSQDDWNLIAAAPQLLEGAIDAREAILYERFSLAEAGLTGDQINAVLGVFDDFLGAAIAKAEGK